MKAVSKEVDDMIVYQTDSAVSVGYKGGGFGSVVASRTYNSISCASEKYNTLKDKESLHKFMVDNEIVFP
jgi:hypothetical protein